MTGSRWSGRPRRRPRTRTSSGGTATWAPLDPAGLADVHGRLRPALVDRRRLGDRGVHRRAARARGRRPVDPGLRRPGAAGARRRPLAPVEHRRRRASGRSTTGCPRCSTSTARSGSAASAGALGDRPAAHAGPGRSVDQQALAGARRCRSTRRPGSPTTGSATSTPRSCCFYKARLRPAQGRARPRPRPGRCSTPTSGPGCATPYGDRMGCRSTPWLERLAADASERRLGAGRGTPYAWTSHDPDGVPRPRRDHADAARRPSRR